MATSPTPPTERRRLSALKRYSVMDTSPEGALDDIALLASQLADCPTAFVTFLDEKRNWTKSGVNIELGETPRHLSLAEHMLTAPDELLIVPDTLKDERFANHASVTGEPHVRFFAAAPIFSIERHVIGALCVADSNPRRRHNEKSVGALVILARQVSAHLESQREIATLKVDRTGAFAQTQIDSVTGLPLCHVFLERLRRTINIRNLRPSPVLLTIEPDNARTLRDNCDPARWESAVVRIAGKLRQCLREGDSLTRLFDDRFLAIVSDVRRARDVATEMVRVSPVPMRSGAAVIGSGSATVEELVRDSGSALFSAQDLGIENLVFYGDFQNSKRDEGERQRAKADDWCALVSV